MNNLTIPLAILFSILPSISALITIYIKLNSQIIKIESDLKNSKEKFAEYNVSINKLVDKVSELNDKYTNFIIELTLKNNAKQLN